MSLNTAEHWLSTIAHQVKVTQHNWSVLLRHHLPITSHFRTMRRVARAQAKERLNPTTPSNAYSRQVQAANKMMREQLYVKRKAAKRPKLSTKVRHARHGRTSGSRILQGQQLLSGRGPTLRQHPP